MMSANPSNSDGSSASARPVAPRVEVEEPAFQYVCGDNGADALWCGGSTMMGRIGNDVFLSALERVEGFKPLCNARWRLLKREEGGWECQQTDTRRTREPCPMAVFPDGRLFLYVNPTQALGEQPGGYRDGPATPHVLQFSAADPKAPAKRLMPTWDSEIVFFGHSYRNFAADPANCELFLTNQVSYTEMHWSFYDRDGRFSACGEVKYPWCDEYETPDADRICYHNIALKDRAVYVLGVNDIVEPVTTWREHKYSLTNRKWDFIFRRLFFSWTPDVTTEPFAPWQKLVDLDATGGDVHNMDLHLAPNGHVHLLWIQQTTDPRIGEKFLPDVKNVFKLEHWILDGGEVVSRDTLVTGGEGVGGQVPVHARFQPTPDGRLLVFSYINDWTGGREADAQGRGGNFVMEVFPDGTHSEAVRVPMENPTIRFLTATPRAGSAASDTIDVIGQPLQPLPHPGAGKDVFEQSYSYARVRLI